MQVLCTGLNLHATSRGYERPINPAVAVANSQGRKCSQIEAIAAFFVYGLSSEGYDRNNSNKRANTRNYHLDEKRPPGHPCRGGLIRLR